MARIFADSKKAVKQAVALFKDNIYLGIDTETSSLDPHTCKLWSIQFGDEKNQVMVPINGKPGRFNLQPLFELFTNPRIKKIFHRASFDLKVLWRNGLDANGIICTRTLEQIITAGTFADTSLAGTLRRHLGVQMSKQARKEFYCAEDGKEADSRNMITVFENRGCEWTPELREYALGDVEHLVPLAKRQIRILEEEEMKKLASKIELPLVYVTGLIEYRGVAMDAKKCKAFQVKMAKRADEVKTDLVKKLNPLWHSYARPLFTANYALYKAWADAHTEIVKRTNKNRNPENKKKISDAAMAERKAHELLRPFRTPPKEPVDININSTQQLRNALAQDGVFLKDMRKETLQENASLHPLIELIVEYRKYEKLASMAEIYEKINKATGRLHGDLNQIVDTGRYSSRNPNLQNIPARAEESSEFRSCFIAPKGCTLIVADYAAIELVIAGVMSTDEGLLYALNNVEDLHCYTMSKFLDCSYEALVAVKEHSPNHPTKPKLASEKQFTDVRKARKRFESKFALPELIKTPSIDDAIVKWVKTLRDYVKTLTYGIAYGLSAFGLSRRFHCDNEVAQQFIDTFFTVYPRLKSWLDKKSDFAQKNKYSKSASGRRRYYSPPPRPGKLDIEAEVKKFFDEQDREMDSVTDEEYDSAFEDMKKKLNREWYSIINRIRRQGANQPIQGTSADITKYAMVLWEDWWAEYAPENDIDIRQHGIVLTVHDELVAQVPNSCASPARAALKVAMEKSAHAFLGTDIKITVEPKTASNWKEGK